LENARPTALQTQGTRKATFPTRTISQPKGKENLPNDIYRKMIKNAHKATPLLIPAKNKVEKNKNER
jgi:hypothetical protein